MRTALVIGAGPAGLMAAEVLAASGLSVTVIDQMPTIGRKFLMAGKSGLNITHAGPDFLAAYPEMPAALRCALDGFGPAELVAWCTALGQPVFTGSTGRVYPVAMKASPLLRAWRARLLEAGVAIRTRLRWDGFVGDALRLSDNTTARADVTILACGGASWARLGSDGLWARHLGDQIAAFAPSNAGLDIRWSPYMARHFGTPLKAVAFAIAGRRIRGEAMISERGLEGGGVYAFSAQIRAGHALHLDLLPDIDRAALATRLAQARRGDSLASRLRKVGLNPAKAALAREFANPLPGPSQKLAAVLKSLPIRYAGLRPLDEAISSAGGLSFAALDARLMLKSRPGIFAAGEMLDWDAPTGGYLLTACLATGRHAALSARDWLAEH